MPPSAPKLCLARVYQAPRPKLSVRQRASHLGGSPRARRRRRVKSRRGGWRGVVEGQNGRRRVVESRRAGGVTCLSSAFSQRPCLPPSFAQTPPKSPRAPPSRVSLAEAALRCEARRRAVYVGQARCEARSRPGFAGGRRPSARRRAAACRFHASNRGVLQREGGGVCFANIAGSGLHPPISRSLALGTTTGRVGARRRGGKSGVPQVSQRLRGTRGAWMGEQVVPGRGSEVVGLRGVKGQCLGVACGSL